MISRRDFLGASTLAAAGAALGPASTLAGQAHAEAQQALPPSIARLTSRAAEAKPITVEERAARVEQAKRLMRQNGLSALYLTGGTSMVYFTGINWGGGERLFAVTIPVDGDPFVVCPYFEEDRAREQLAMGPLKDAKVMTWLEDQSPYALVAQGLKDAGIATGNIGCEETVQFRFSNGLALAAPASQVVSGTPVTAGCRGVKSEHEIALMQLANEVT
ncbi:MAG: aminopeptidase P family N-terminal domain-containing protein, partial [Gemmatimonadetes bacterium]|nr:aminopeptidase P family N-terminal domain-containing protein [Gemmatimonadota bacterium]